VQFKLASPVNPNSNAKIELETVFSHVMVPLPKEIEQRETQTVVFKSTFYFFSPYKSSEQTIDVKLPSSVIKSKPEEQPISLRGQEIVYGPFHDIPAYAEKEMKLHFENNRPFVTLKTVTREIEISHWRGQVSVEENVEAVHDGAKV